MKLSVCIDAVFQGEPMAGLSTACELGYGAIEFWGWWNRDLEALLAEKNRLGLEVVAFCTKMISIVAPSQRMDYVDGLKQSVEIAQRFGSKRLITQTGQSTGSDRAKQHEALFEGLVQCLPILERAGVTLLVEPLNESDHPGYYLQSTREAFDLICEVGSPYVKLLYDVYHQQVTEGDILRTVEKHIDKIGHFHLAGNPGRHELYSGELNYDFIVKAIDSMGYDGYFGLEYFPAEEVEKGLVQALRMAR